MKIGDLELDTGAPDPERLLASTGQSVAAMRQLLDSHLIAGIVASALQACLKDESLSTPDLAERIAEAGVDEVRLAVSGLYKERKAPATPRAKRRTKEAKR